MEKQKANTVCPPSYNWVIWLPPYQSKQSLEFVEHMQFLSNFYKADTAKSSEECFQSGNVDIQLPLGAGIS
jgi:hypothetical protein